ncbi:hypothetical protein E2C01_049668 [Portunus trituberculatus]|uniref:Uncharacterized protein n=1 Tax=Portunus trituberculatus TaxID=210409 RepID=A0A5B7GGP1_PORTR|nr:hypothetical protein [Portunus trituberculatus]
MAAVQAATYPPAGEGEEGLLWGGGEGPVCCPRPQPRGQGGVEGREGEREGGKGRGSLSCLR